MERNNEILPNLAKLGLFGHIQILFGFIHIRQISEKLPTDLLLDVPAILRGSLDSTTHSLPLTNA
jgi:hypothetical protein